MSVVEPDSFGRTLLDEVVKIRDAAVMWLVEGEIPYTNTAAVPRTQLDSDAYSYETCTVLKQYSHSTDYRLSGAGPPERDAALNTR